ncbi:MAG TPA: DUF6049 family protein [Terrimesophilobacter sp.]|nr:DUF6049 family protein [Terrimesophilobacter sp.]
MRILPLLITLGLAVGGVAVPGATMPIDEGGVSIIAAPAFSGILPSGQPLVISGSISNSSAQTMDAGTATVYLGHSKLSTRAAVSKWLGTNDSSGQDLGSAIGTLAVGELAAGQVRSFIVTVPASAIGLPDGQPGVYPIAVRLAAAAVQVDLVRSTVVWASGGTPTDINLAVVTPLVVAPSTSGILSANDLGQLTAPGGQLDTELTTDLTHGLAIGVDPMIIASIRLLGTSAPPSARNWLSRLESSASSVFTLSYADADLALQRRAGATQPLAPTAFPIDPGMFPVVPGVSPAPSGSPTPTSQSTVPTPEALVSLSGAISGLAWSNETGLTEQDLDFLSAGGYTRILAASSALAGTTGASPNVTIGDHQVTVSDTLISTAFRQAALAKTDAEWSFAMASLTGLLSAAASEHPGSTVVATLGRGGAATGASIERTLGAVESLSWVRPTSLGAALSITSTPSALAADTQSADRTATAQALLASESDTARFATVADDPSLITGPNRLALLALLSVSWENDPAGWASAADAYLADGVAVRSSVRLPDSSQINFIQEKGNLPIAVRNELNVPVTVYVTVRPDRAILDVLNDRVELKIEANSQAKALVPVQSIANGEVRTLVNLTAADGTQISTPTFVVLNVQAGWETAATVILAIIVVLLFAGGVWRTVLRSRKARAQRAEDRADES